MKIQFIVQTPDCLQPALEYIDDEDLREAVEELSKKWIKYGESLTLEIDTDTETCIVLEA